MFFHLFLQLAKSSVLIFEQQIINNVIWIAAQELHNSAKMSPVAGPSLEVERLLVDYSAGNAFVL